MKNIDFSDATKMLNDMKGIIEDNKRMKATFEHYQEYAAKIKNIGKQLIDLAEEIDPYQKTARNGTNTNVKDIIAEFYDVCKNGSEVTRELILNTYPELTPNNMSYIMTTLKDMPHLKIRKDGVKNILYYG